MDNEIPEIDIDALDALRSEGSPVLDVRELDEWQEAHIPGVVHIPLTELVERVDEVPTAESLPIVCAAGGRSMQAAQFLADRGLVTVNVAGGTKAWIASGRLTERGA